MTFADLSATIIRDLLETAGYRASILPSARATEKLKAEHPAEWWIDGMAATLSSGPVGLDHYGPPPAAVAALVGGAGTGALTLAARFALCVWQTVEGALSVEEVGELTDEALAAARDALGASEAWKADLERILPAQIRLTIREGAAKP